MKKRVLILCTGNSCRSQMAEGIWRALGGTDWESCSAGSNPAGYVHPLALRVLGEAGIDLPDARSKHVSEFQNQRFDMIVTVCDSAKESCPVLPGAGRTVHWPFDDPAHTTGTEAERLVAFRRVRDEIKAKIEAFLQTCA